MEFLKKQLNRLLRSRLARGSFVLLVGTTLANAGNYLYHLLVGRFLGPVDYGALESVVSLTYYFGIPLATLNLVIVKKVSYYSGQGRKDRISNFYHYLCKRLVWFFLSGWVLVLFLAPAIGNFLHLPNYGPVWAIGISSLLAVFVTINLAFLQGILKFEKVALTNIAQVAVKVAVSFLLVRLGWRVLGASLGFVGGAMVGLIISVVTVRNIIPSFKNKVEINPTFRKAVSGVLPSFVLTLSFTSFYTTDIILARHYLSGYEAGLYSALSVLAKIVFFIVNPILAATFPIISQAAAAKKKHDHLFLSSFGLISLISGGVVLIYYLWPQLMIRLMFGAAYLEAAELLVWFGFFTFFYGLAHSLAQYFLSVGKEKWIWVSLLAALGQVALLTIFHHSISDIMHVSLATCFALFGFYALIYLAERRKGGKRKPSC